MKPQKNPYPFHPILFATFMPLFLLAQNPGWFHVSVIVRPLVLIIGCVLLSWCIIDLLFFRDIRKTALFITMNVLCFFSYGYVRILMGGVAFTIAGFHAGCNVILLTIWLMIVVGGLMVIGKTRKIAVCLTKMLNLAGTILILFSMARIVFVTGGSRLHTHQGEDIVNQLLASYKMRETPEERPDILYIILDTYPRSDVLKETYHYDNSDLIDFLERREFSVSRTSYSNYGKTDLSLASSLNFNYIQNLLPSVSAVSRDVKPLIELKVDGRVVRFLKGIGYRFVLLSNGLETIEQTYADNFAGPIWSFNGKFFDEFQNGLLKMTPLPFFFSLLSRDLSEFERHRQRVLFSFDYLSEYRKTKEPKFILAHIIAPHDPLVFGADGEQIDNKESYWELLETDPQRLIRLFRNEAIFVGKKIEETVNGILAHNPDTKPVIIIQSDHGSSMVPPVDHDPSKEFLHQRHGIFTAVYIPYCDSLEHRVEGISPVNLFRLIFNCCFDLGLPMLRNKFFFCNEKRPYDFFDISDSLAGLQIKKNVTEADVMDSMVPAW